MGAEMEVAFALINRGILRQTSPVDRVAPVIAEIVDF